MKEDGEAEMEGRSMMGGEGGRQAWETLEMSVRPSERASSRDDPALFRRSRQGAGSEDHQGGISRVGILSLSLLAM